MIACLLVGLFAVACRQVKIATTTPARASVAAEALSPDADADGFPEAIELKSASDRENFRQWFTAIAEMQFHRASDAWSEEQRDCAGLVRFAFREALRAHDRLWFQKMGGEYEPIAPDVRGLRLTDNPLGEKLFRTDYGAFNERDLAAGKFSEFADARTLKNHNAVFVGRQRDQAEAGDLLFYHQPWVQKYPFHVMIFLGRPRTDSAGAADWVVYHTGASPQDKGTVKRMRLSTLARHPDRRWRPVEGNRNFLGFYRLKILEQT